MKSKFIFIMIMLGLLLFFTGAGICQEKVSMNDWVEKFNQGSINWTGGYIEATGIGAPADRSVGKINMRPMALRAAKIDALRNLLEIAKGVRVDSRTTVRDFTVKSDVINKQVSGLVQGAVVADQQYISDGTVEVKLRMPLYGDLAQTVLPATIEGRKEVKEQEKPAAPAPPPATLSAVTSPAPSTMEAPAPAPAPAVTAPAAPVAPASDVTASTAPPAPAPPPATPSAVTPPVPSTAEAPAPAPVPAVTTPAAPVAPASAVTASAAPPAPAPSAPVVYTGIVARGIQARPAMSLRIFDQDGKEIYGSANVDREFAVQQGMSGYARSLTAAQSNERVTANPVTVKALKTTGPGKSDVVISNADAQQIRAAAEDAAFMKQCRVMIVLD
jgi:hypothetical protein